MNTVELDRLFDQVVKKTFSPAEFVGLSVDEGRRLKFAPGQPPRRL